MAKRKATKQRTKKESPKNQGKGLFQVRFDQELLDRLKAAASDAGISMNQLMQGMCRACMDHLMQGEATKARDGFVAIKSQKGCVSFGRPGREWEQNERENFEADTGGEGGPYADKGEFFFGLDFTERVIRSDAKR